MAKKVLNQLDLQGNKIIGLADGVNPQDAVNRSQLDAAAAGLDPKGSVRVATTANIALTGTQTIDGVAVVAGDRVLVKNQTTGSENGIYVVAAGAWTRATDADTSAEVNGGMYVFVEEGTANADTGWVLTTNNPITLGTTALVFTKFTAAATGLSRFATNIGDGAATSYTVTHNLGTLDVVVEVFENSTGAQVFVDVVHATINTVTITFGAAPAANAYRVVVIG